jgi:thioesterase domain-containing protein
VYESLAKLLGPDQPFYSLCPRELDASYTMSGDDPVAPSSIEHLAERCIASLRSRQPAGPYLLGGWSIGGVVAFEMARQLRASGEEVSLLALFDSPTPAAPSSRVIDDSALVPAFASYLGARQGLSFPSAAGLWNDTSLDERLKGVLEWGKRVALFPTKHELPQVQELFSAYRHGLQAAVSHLVDYRPEVYPGRIVYFRATRVLDSYEAAFPNADRGWKAWTSQPIETIIAMGDHYSMLLDPHVKTLAAEFRRLLRADAASVDTGNVA